MISTLTKVVASSVLKPPPGQDQQNASAVLFVALLFTGVMVAILVWVIVSQKNKRKQSQVDLLDKALPAGYDFIARADFDYRVWSVHDSLYYSHRAYNLLFKLDGRKLLNIAFAQVRNGNGSWPINSQPYARAVFGVYVGGNFPSLSVRRQNSAFLNGPDLDLDSSAFNDTFVVDSRDEAAATAFLHTGMIEYLLESTRRSAGSQHMGGFHLENGWLTTVGPVIGAHRGQRSYSWAALNSHLDYLQGIADLIPLWVAKDHSLVLNREVEDYYPLAELFPGILRKVAPNSPAREKEPNWDPSLTQPDPSSNEGLAKTIFWGGVAGAIIGPIVGAALLGILEAGHLLGGSILPSIFVGAGAGIATTVGIRNLMKWK